MGTIKDPIPVKLFIGMLTPDLDLFDGCIDILTREYGLIDLQSEILPWDRTDYYLDEMGPNIYRKFIFFGNLTDAASLAGVKLLTNALEQRFSTGTGKTAHRRINLDPGYITEAKVVLATTKDFAHRIYIGSGIYAEVTLTYSAAVRSFTAIPHTYPDYGTDASKSLFNAGRTLLRKQLDKTRTRKRGGSGSRSVA